MGKGSLKNVNFHSKAMSDIIFVSTIAWTAKNWLKRCMQTAHFNFNNQKGTFVTLHGKTGNNAMTRCNLTNAEKKLENIRLR